MDLDTEPPWSKSQLRKLGEALLDKCPPPSGCPDYGAVMLWHNDLASTIADVVNSRQWDSQGVEEFAVTARSKTVDTLIQKLERSTLKLDRVQDLAGVRIDTGLSLTKQTQLANEIAAYFGTDRVTVRDLRQDPHSGYRAVHLWLVLPAGRVEIQIRTIYQSLWANVYEGLADLFGRGIRYDQAPDNPAGTGLVQHMHQLSAEIAHDEAIADNLENVMDQWLAAFVDRAGTLGVGPPDPSLIDKALDVLSAESPTGYMTRLQQSAEHLRALRRILES